VVHQIKEQGAKAGVALNPATPIESIEWVLSDLDRVLVMTVNPGFGGQAFIPETLPKIAALRKRCKEQGLSFEIAVDGGIDLQTAPRVVEAGADVLTAGSFIFGYAGGLKAAVDALRRTAEQASAK
jgi:ribulose-phosphate 3-epimerase